MTTAEEIVVARVMDEKGKTLYEGDFLAALQWVKAETWEGTVIPARKIVRSSDGALLASRRRLDIQAADAIELAELE